MMQFYCSKCNKEMMVHTVVGSVPPQVPLKCYCSEECLSKAHEENTNEGNQDLQSMPSE